MLQEGSTGPKNSGLPEEGWTGSYNSGLTQEIRTGPKNVGVGAAEGRDGRPHPNAGLTLPYSSKKPCTD
ncbi:hypothetical protein DdX_08857 [Ditylenchus destructor]|uniref:Uncharacterized protein n=1 Tax=Ditylenchus destructor TaxID=166010 RepID=A0AAD4N345_9BILA|nr:hypothetical protein DdX_08857 [Ditylenchus destructor]